MQFKDFMDMLATELKSHKDLIAADKTGPYGAAISSELGGIACQVCLTADGAISAEQTAVVVSFRLAVKRTE